MGPGVKSGFAGGRSVANVGLGQARGYASAARPLLDNFVSNAPRSFASPLSVLLPHSLADPFHPSLPLPPMTVLLRAGLNELEDQVSDLKKQKKGNRSSVLAKGKKRSSTSSRAQSIFQSTTLPIRRLTNTKSTVAGVSRPSAEQENEEEEDFNTFFHPSVRHSLPAARSPWSTTTLTIPLSPGSIDGLPSSSISHLVTHHRASFDQHRARLDALLYSLERKGVWLDQHVRVESEEDEVRIVFESRSREEVEAIVGQRSGEGTWWVMSERRKGSSNVKSSTTTRLEGSLVFPLLSASVIVPSFGASPLSLTSETEEFDGRSSVLSNSTFLSDDDNDDASSLGFSSAFLSDLSVSSAGQQGFTLVDLEGMEGFDEDWGDA